MSRGRHMNITGVSSGGSRCCSNHSLIFSNSGANCRKRKHQVTQSYRHNNVFTFTEHWYVANVSTFPNTLLLFCLWFLMNCLELTRTDAVFSRIAFGVFLLCRVEKFAENSTYQTSAACSAQCQLKHSHQNSETIYKTHKPIWCPQQKKYEICSGKMSWHSKPVSG